MHSLHQFMFTITFICGYFCTNTWKNRILSKHVLGGLICEIGTPSLQLLPLPPICDHHHCHTATPLFDVQGLLCYSRPLCETIWSTYWWMDLVFSLNLWNSLFYASLCHAATISGTLILLKSSPEWYFSNNSASPITEIAINMLKEVPT